MADIHDRGKSRAVVSEFRSLFGDIAPSMPAGSRPFVNPGAGEAGAGGVGYMRASLVIRSLAEKLPRDKERGSREIAALQEEKASWTCRAAQA